MSFKRGSISLNINTPIFKNSQGKSINFPFFFRKLFCISIIFLFNLFSSKISLPLSNFPPSRARSTFLLRNEFTTPSTPSLDPITDDFARWLESRWTHESRCVLEWQLDGRWRFSRSYGLSYGVARSRGMRATCPAMCSSLPQLPLIHGACCCVMWSRNRTVPYDHPKKSSSRSRSLRARPELEYNEPALRVA